MEGHGAVGGMPERVGVRRATATLLRGEEERAAWRDQRKPERRDGGMWRRIEGWRVTMP
jgi:hypothetical protein